MTWVYSIVLWEIIGCWCNTDCLCIITYRQNTVSIMSLYLASWITLIIILLTFDKV